MAQLNFDATAVAPQQSFTPVPAGVYTVTIIDSEVRPTKTGTGTQVVVTLQIVDGEFKNRRVYARINNQNSSADAERIGQGQLSALCHAAGVLHLKDTVQLHGKTIRAKVKVRKDENYGDSNDVTGYEALTGGAVPPVGVPAAVAAAAKPATVPWKKQAVAA